MNWFAHACSAVVYRTFRPGRYPIMPGFSPHYPGIPLFRVPTATLDNCSKRRLEGLLSASRGLLVQPCRQGFGRIDLGYQVAIDPCHQADTIGSGADDDVMVVNVAGIQPQGSLF